jgi:hypothetical protein
MCWRKQYNELHNWKLIFIKYYYDNASKWRTSARQGRDKKCTHIFLKGKKSLERPSWEDNVKMNLTEAGLKGVNWIHMTQDRN